MERALFLIEVMSVPAISWLGATLELRVGAKLFQEYEDGFEAETRKYFYHKVHDEFQSKIFGDAGKDLASTLFKLASENIASEGQPSIDLHSIAYSPDLEVFGSNLYQEVDKQSTAAQTQINRIAQTVNNSYTFGDAIVKRLQKETHGFDRLAPRIQFEMGTKLINGLMQDMRNDWASRWLYYGNDPPHPSWPRIIRELERELWCVWILQQNFHSKKHGWNLFDEDYKVSGASGEVFDQTGGIASSYEDSPITTRLFEDFNAPLMDYKLDWALKTHSKIWADQQAQKIRDWAGSGDFSYITNQLRGVARSLQPVEQMWGGASMQMSAP